MSTDSNIGSNDFYAENAAALLGSLGGKARAKKYTKEQLSAMGKKGGRPKKKLVLKDNR